MRCKSRRGRCGMWRGICEFVAMVALHDYVLAITRDGDLWKISHNHESGDVIFTKLGRLR